jgi:hypothetical protein
VLYCESMNLLDLFRTPKPTPIEETPVKVETNRPKKTPIPGAPELPGGYYYSVRVEPPEEWKREKIEFYLWVDIYLVDERESSDYRVDTALDVQYTASERKFGYFEPANLTATAIKVYQKAFPAPIVLNIPESISDYIGDHRA